MSCFPLRFLPCACAASPSAASPSGFCTLAGCVSMSGSSLLVCSRGWFGRFFAVPLGFSHVPCSSSGPAACAVFPAAGSLRVFASYVRMLQLHWCLLGLTVRSPCCPSLTLGWVCFWPTVSTTQGITLRPCLVQLHPGTYVTLG